MFFEVQVPNVVKESQTRSTRSIASRSARAQRARRDTLFVLIFALVASCGSGARAHRGDLRTAARDVMRASKYCALVTVDDQGRPRARTVHPFPPGNDFVVWIATRPVTRKVEQIRADPNVTLYYFDAERLEYVTLMGRARLVDDLEEKKKRRNLISFALYPDWPEDCLLIEVTPERLEVQAKGVDPDDVTWRPQSLEFTGTE
jgi:general stress protein 26